MRFPAFSLIGRALPPAGTGLLSLALLRR